MTTLVREPGTYRTTAGELVHFRIDREGALTIEFEDRDPRDAVAGRLGGELVKLSDDPDWPDVSRRHSDPALFAD
jgi:hypothetical protein